MSDKFVERKFEEVKGGYYDDYGFYYTPNGSFWDDEGYYFNREGKDKHGGYYDDNFNYVPGEDWDEKNQCYLSELENDDYDEEDEDDFDDFDNLGYENFKKQHGEQDYEDFYDDEDDVDVVPTKVINSNFCENDVNKQEEIKTEVIYSNTKEEEKEKSNDENLINIDSKKEIIPTKKNKLDDLFGNTTKNTTTSIIDKSANTGKQNNTKTNKPSTGNTKKK